MNPSLKKWLWRISGTILLLAVLAVIAVALGLAWLASESGLVWIVAQIEQRVSREDLEVDIGEIRELTSRRAVISDLTLKDGEEVYLTAEDIRLVYDWRDIAALNPRLEALRAGTIRIHRLPAREEARREEGIALPVLPDLNIGDFRIDNFMLDPSLTGQEEHMGVSGTLVSSSELYENRINLRVTDSRTGNVLADIRFNPDRRNNTLNFAMQVEDKAGGPLARFFDERPIRILLDGDGTLGAWKGHLDARFGDAAANVDLLLDLRGNRMGAVAEGQWTAAGLETDGRTTLRYNPQNGEAVVSFAGTASKAGYGLRGLDVVFGAEPERAVFKPEVPVLISARGRVAEVFTLDDGTPVADLENISFDILLRQAGTALTIREALVRNRFGEAQLTGGADLADKEVDIKAVFVIPDLAAFRDDLRGKMEAALNLSGTYEPLALEGAVNVTTGELATPWQEMRTVFGADPRLTAALAVTPGGVTITDGRLRGQETLEFEGTVTMEGAANLNLHTHYQGYSIYTGFTLEQNRVTASDIDITGPAGALSGRLAYNRAGDTFSGAVTFDGADGYRVTMNLSGNADRPVFSGTISGTDPISYNFDYGGYGLFDPVQQMVFERFAGQFAENELALRDPATVRFGEDGAVLQPASFMLEDGTITLSGAWREGVLAANANLSGVPADLGLPPFTWPGRMSGVVTVNGPLENLQGNLALDLTQMELPGAAGLGEQYASGTVTGRYRDNVLNLETELTGPADISLRAEGRVPLSLVPFGVRMQEPVQGTVAGNIDLFSLALLTGLDRHRLQGQASLDVAVSGTAAQPVISGSAALLNGQYENIVTGMILRDVTGRASISNNRVIIEEIAGYGPEGGTFTGSGQADLTDYAKPAFNLDLATSDFQILNNENMELKVTSVLNAVGGGEAATVAGEVTVNHAEYYFSGFAGSSDFAGFTIVEKGTPEAAAAIEAAELEIPYRINLSGVRLRARNGVFIRSPELDSEWEAQLTLYGTVENPLLEGTASLIRGRYEMLGTPVLLTEGTLRFFRADPPDPMLDISGVITGREMDALLRLTGTARSPSLTVTSDPPMPEDEVMANVLFGTSADRLAPMQALRIAQILSAFAGEGAAATLDPLSNIRKELGLDILEFSMDDDSGAALSAGKYISPNAYIAIDQGVSPGSAGIRLEIELTDRIELETKINSSDESSVGINYKRDY